MYMQGDIKKQSTMSRKGAASTVQLWPMLTGLQNHSTIELIRKFTTSRSLTILPNLECVATLRRGICGTFMSSDHAAGLWDSQCCCPWPWGVVEYKFWVLGLGLEQKSLASANFPGHLRATETMTCDCLLYSFDSFVTVYCVNLCHCWVTYS